MSIQVKLTTDGDFKGMEKVDYNTVFTGRVYTIRGKVKGVDIKLHDLIAAGADPDLEKLNGTDAIKGELYFSNGTSNFMDKEYEEE